MKKNIREDLRETKNSGKENKETREEYWKW